MYNVGGNKWIHLFSDLSMYRGQKSVTLSRGSYVLRRCIFDINLYHKACKQLEALMQGRSYDPIEKGVWVRMQMDLLEGRTLEQASSIARDEEIALLFHRFPG